MNECQRDDNTDRVPHAVTGTIVMINISMHLIVTLMLLCTPCTGPFQLYLQSTPLPLKSGQISSVLSAKSRANNHSHVMTRQLVLLSCNNSVAEKKHWSATYRSRRQLHWSTDARCCCWSRSDTCRADPASREESETHKHFYIEPCYLTNGSNNGSNLEKTAQTL